MSDAAVLTSVRQAAKTNWRVRLAVMLARYRADLPAFIREQLKIRTKEGTLIPFQPWPCQDVMLSMALAQQKETGMIRLATLKARQVGGSALSEGIVSHRAMLFPNTNALIMASDKELAETLFRISKTFYDHLDPSIRPLRRLANKREFLFENPSDDKRSVLPGLGSSMVITSAESPGAGIGRTLRAAHLSECARFPSPEVVVDGVFPALARAQGTVCILETTAQYGGDWFRSFYEKAERGEGDFRAVFVPWYLNPEYRIALLAGEKLRLSLEERQWSKQYGLSPEQIKFFRAQLATMGDPALFAQSFPFTALEAWISPGDNVFPWKKIDEQRTRHMADPVRVADVWPGPKILDDPRGRLWIWEEPEANKQYDIGGDVALGADSSDDPDASDRDWSVLEVLERGSNRQVAEWRARSVNPIELATTAYWLGMYYNMAQLAIEYGSIGTATNMQLAKLGYANIYLWRYRDERSTRFSKKIGWETTLRTKKLLVAFALHELMNDRVVIRSKRLLDEMRTYIRAAKWDDTRAAPNFHDDHVMAWQIALLASDDENFEKWMSGAQTKEAKAQESNPVALAAGSVIPQEEWNSDTDFLHDLVENEAGAWE